MEKISPFFPQMGKPWTHDASLPGGDFPVEEVNQRMVSLAQQFPFLDRSNAQRLFRAYGTDAEKILEGSRSVADLGPSFGPLSAREITWLKDREWALNSDDILWRRSKLGLHMSEKDQGALRNFMSEENNRQVLQHVRS